MRKSERHLHLVAAMILAAVPAASSAGREDTDRIADTGQPAIERLGEIRRGLLKLDERDPSRTERKPSRLAQLWCNFCWQNWGNWANWSNFWQNF